MRPAPIMSRGPWPCGGADVGEEGPQPAIAVPTNAMSESFWIWPVTLTILATPASGCSGSGYPPTMGSLNGRPMWWIVVGIGDGDIDELDASLTQQGDQLLGSVRSGLV